jgi:hypothetical protein
MTVYLLGIQKADEEPLGVRSSSSRFTGIAAQRPRRPAVHGGLTSAILDTVAEAPHPRIPVNRDQSDPGPQENPP